MKPPIHLVVALVVAVGCARAELAARYFARCPAEGPETATDLGLRLAPLDLNAFYDTVRSRAATFEINELGVVRDGTAD